MIEVIYDRSEEDTPKGEIQGIRLPKNIRQVGTPQGSRKIYVEDYVITYLNQLAKPGNTYARGAILLGEYKQSEGQGVLFISGAIEAQNVEFDMEETEFSNEIWSKIYAEVKRFFPDLEVVGWFLSRMGFTTQVNEKITKMHLDNFPGRDKVLYMIDSLEEEDAWYFYENGALKKQGGYYIYYTRNDTMQNYMMTQTSHMVESETDIAERDQDLLDAYRKRLEQRRLQAPVQEKKSAGFFYVASSLLTVACLALGIAAISNYDRLKHLEVAFERMAVMTDGGALAKEDSEGTEETIPVANVITVDANVSPIEDSDRSSDKKDTGASDHSEDNASDTDDTSSSEDTEAVSDSGQSTENTASNADTGTDQQTENENQTEAAWTTAVPSDETNEEPEAVVTVDGVKYYTVKSGDTLSSISFSMYHSILYVDDIIDANGLSSGDDIAVGQILIIPDIS